MHTIVNYACPLLPFPRILTIFVELVQSNMLSKKYEVMGMADSNSTLLT